MNIKIVYFSGTGNTKLITQELKKKFEASENKVELIIAENAIQGTSLLKVKDNAKLIGLSFPVYDLLPPRIIDKCIDMLPRQTKPVPIFLYSTMAFIKGDCLNIVAKKLKSKGYYTIAKKGFRCPSNGVVAYELPNHARYRNVRFEKDIDMSIAHYAEQIMEAYVEFKVKPYAKIGGVYPHYNLIRSISEKTYGEKYYLDLRINDNCTNCGVCSKACPDHNIRIYEGETTVIKDNDCLRCLRCVCLCPQNAITFTSSRLVKRYTPQLMHQLYKEACNKN